MLHAGAGLLVPGGAIEISLLGALAIVLMAVGTWVFLSARLTAAQREKRRRLTVNRTGRMGDANINDVRDYVLFYSYELRGVAYATSQDVSEFKHLLPAETSQLIGPVEIKYTPNNPANSIIISEQWSGLRPIAPQVQGIPTKENSHP
jgi:hypothetical protein